MAKFPYLWLLVNLLIVTLVVLLVALAFELLPLHYAIQTPFLAIQIMLMFMLVFVTWWYARETARISQSSEEAAKAAVKQAELAGKVYAPDLIVYPKDRYPRYGEHLVPSALDAYFRDSFLQGIGWRIVLDNPGLVPILIVSFRLEVKECDPDSVSESGHWKEVPGGCWRAVEENGREIEAGVPFRVEPRAPGLTLHIFLCTEDALKLLSELGGQSRRFKLRAHFGYKTLGLVSSEQERITHIESEPFRLPENAQFGKVTTY
jgi:hypothetical protein